MVAEAYSHRAKLYTFALSLAKSPAVAEDLVQDTWEKVLKYWGSYTPGTNLRAWLYRILTGRWIDLYNQRRRVDTKHDNCRANMLLGTYGQLEEYTTQPDTVTSYSDETIALLGKLTTDHRDILISYANVPKEGAYRTLATELGLKPATIGSRLSRARQAAKRVIQEPTGPDARTVLASQHVKQRRSGKTRALG